jgi:hypothetical protein
VNKVIQWTEKGLDRYIRDICDSIDVIRSQLWEEEKEYNQPVDNHSRLMARQSAQAECLQAILDYREERISFSELVMSLQSFDPKVTPPDIIKLLGRQYYG